MATGLEMYDAVYEATRRLSPGSTFILNALDAIDLRKLTVRDLVSRRYDESVAEIASAALLQGDFRPFAQSLGVQFVLSDDAPHLISSI